GLAAHRGDGRDVDDVASGMDEQVRNRRLHRVERAVEVHADDAVPLVVIDLFEAQAAPGAGGVDQNVEPPKGADGAVDRCAHGGGLGNVAGGRFGVAAG